jgi:hypothetical protein
MVNDGILGLPFETRDHIEHLLRREVANEVLQCLERDLGRTGLFAFAAQDAGIPHLVGPNQMEQGIWGRHLASFHPVSQIQPVRRFRIDRTPVDTA